MPGQTLRMILNGIQRHERTHPEAGRFYSDFESGAFMSRRIDANGYSFEYRHQCDGDGRESLDQFHARTERLVLALRRQLFLI